MPQLNLIPEDVLMRKESTPTVKNKLSHGHNFCIIPLCCCLESADSRFMFVMMKFLVRTGKQVRIGLQGAAAGDMREGQGEGHGERCGDA